MSHVGRHAVVVEDDAELRRMLLVLLRSMGFGVVGLGSAEAALAWLAMHRAPDLVTVDLRLPGLSGLALCDRLRAAPTTATVPILVLTGSTSAADHAAVAAHGAVWLDKPFDHVAWRTAIEQLVPPLPVVRTTTAPQGVHFFVRSDDVKR